MLWVVSNSFRLLLPPLTTSEGYAAPLKYNAKVVASIARQVYQAEKLAPPTNISAWANAYAQIWARGTSAQWYQSIAKNGEWAKVGVYVSDRLFLLGGKQGCLGTFRMMSSGPSSE